MLWFLERRGPAAVYNQVVECKTMKDSDVSIVVYPHVMQMGFDDVDVRIVPQFQLA